MKQISVGRESFAKFIENDNYYVDKTLFIKETFKNNQGDVLLITRPRRFGKTLAMSTFHEFLRINPANPNNPEDTSYQERLFKDTKIFEDKEFCREHMGKFPVIFVSLKNVEGGDFKSAYEQLAYVVFVLASHFNYLLENKNGKLTASQLDVLRHLFDFGFMCNPDNKVHVMNSLATLTKALGDYHGVKPILLIDEYDVPLAKAAARGYYDDMIDIMRPLFSSALKTNDYLGKAVLTGCLKVAKESIFTGLNNLKVWSILEDGKRAMSEGIGFTKEETQQVLEYYGLDKYADLVTQNYDGYYFGDVHMYCPWDVMNFCDSNYQKANKENARITAGNYWINSSGNDVIEEYMGYIDSDHVEQMQTLVDGGSITSAIRPSLCYGDLKNHDIDDFWTLLLYTGYLTFDPKSLRVNDNTDDDCTGELRIPNKEIRACFRGRILNFYKQNPLMRNYAADLAKGLFSGDAECIERNINGLLAKYVSVRDFATSAPKENYYHGFMNGLLINASTIIQEHHSNMESGLGYADIIVSSASKTEIAILELKQTDKWTDDRYKISLSAINQIKEKMYAEPFADNTSIKHIYAYGICFFQKVCAVTAEKLK